jgi:hypothetical protein
MDREVTVRTGAATLAFFDPELLASHLDDTCDWWCVDFHTLPEVSAGEIGLIGLGGDGVYSVRVTDGDLRPAERAYAAERVVLGCVVSSGQMYVGAGEHVPGEEMAPDPEDPAQAPGFLPLEPGAYEVEAIAINWSRSPEWHTAPGEPVPATAPADVVLRVRPRAGAFTAPSEEPRFFVVSEPGWLFPDEPRQLGPAVGMILTTTVVKRRDELLLKPCGPLSYRPVLPDVTGLEWHDEVDVRVVAVHDDRKEFEAELVARRPAPEAS